MAGKRGRSGPKSTYTKEKGEAILGLIASGVPISRISDKAGMPRAETIYAWKSLHPDFRNGFDDALDCGARVRMEGYERLSEMALLGFTFDEKGEKVEIKDERRKDMLARNYARLAQLIGGQIAQRRKSEIDVTVGRAMTDEQIIARYAEITGQNPKPLPALEAPKASSPKALEGHA